MGNATSSSPNGSPYNDRRKFSFWLVKAKIDQVDAAHKLFTNNGIYTVNELVSCSSEPDFDILLSDIDNIGDRTRIKQAIAKQIELNKKMNHIIADNNGFKLDNQIRGDITRIDEKRPMIMGVFDSSLVSHNEVRFIYFSSNVVNSSNNSNNNTNNNDSNATPGAAYAVQTDMNVYDYMADNISIDSENSEIKENDNVIDDIIDANFGFETIFDNSLDTTQPTAHAHARADATESTPLDGGASTSAATGSGDGSGSGGNTEGYGYDLGSTTLLMPRIFLVDLRIDENTKQNTLYMKGPFLNPSKIYHRKCSKFSFIYASVSDIAKIAQDTMHTHGNYDYLFNNCRHFSSRLMDNVNKVYGIDNNDKTVGNTSGMNSINSINQLSNLISPELVQNYISEYFCDNFYLTDYHISINDIDNDYVDYDYDYDHNIIKNDYKKSRLLRNKTNNTNNFNSSGTSLPYHTSFAMNTKPISFLTVMKEFSEQNERNIVKCGWLKKYKIFGSKFSSNTHVSITATQGFYVNTPNRPKYGAYGHNKSSSSASSASNSKNNGTNGGMYSGGEWEPIYAVLKRNYSLYCFKNSSMKDIVAVIDINKKCEISDYNNNTINYTYGQVQPSRMQFHIGNTVFRADSVSNRNEWVNQINQIYKNKINDLELEDL